MISKELLSEVLNQKILSIKTPFNGRELGYIERYNGIDEHNEHYVKINIYELAHKCKEWVYKPSCYTLESYKDMYELNWKCNVVTNLEETLFTADTEPEAIFKACEWILNNKE